MWEKIKNFPNIEWIVATIIAFIVLNLGGYWWYQHKNVSNGSTMTSAIATPTPEMEEAPTATLYPTPSSFPTITPLPTVRPTRAPPTPTKIIINVTQSITATPMPPTNTPTPSATNTPVPTSSAPSPTPSIIPSPIPT